MTYLTIQYKHNLKNSEIHLNKRLSSLSLFTKHTLHLISFHFMLTILLTTYLTSKPPFFVYPEMSDMIANLQNKYMLYRGFQAVVGNMYSTYIPLCS
ncbi:hypothetical protein C0J52_01726 [Blattella germanica]|nr:hypothetical protein C0J52_01726 [Blattella germanica]